MSAFGKKLRRAQGSDGVAVYCFWCPGCDKVHAYHVGGQRGWQFNENPDQPSFSPSLLVFEYLRDDGTVYQPRCHLFMTNGMLQYCSDSAHKLAGQTVPVPDWPISNWSDGD